MEKKQKKSMFKQNKGITLIALIITIVVLLILAGVALSSITGNDGAMNKAKQARAENEKGAEADSVRLAVVSAMSQNTETYGRVKEEYLTPELNKIGATIVTAETTDTQITIQAASGRKFIIERTGVVTEKNGVSLDKSTIQFLPDGTSDTLTATLEGVEGTIEWTSSNPEVATVAGTGNNATVTKVGESGTTTITAALSNDPTKKAECTVTIISSVTTISVKQGTTEVTGTTIEIPKNGTSGNLTVSTVPSANVEELDVMSTDESVATATLTGSTLVITAKNVQGQTATIKIFGKKSGVDASTTKAITVSVTTAYTITYDANGGSGTMTATTGTNPVVAACTFTAPSGRIFDGWNTAADGNGTTYAVGNTLSVDTTLYAQWKAPAVGDTVNYSTTLNGQTLNNWKIFHIDGDYTYIILSGYLPNGAVSTEMRSTYNLANGNGSYCINSTTNRGDLINAMSDDYWKSLLTGTIGTGTNAQQIDYRTTENTNIKAMGSPTLDIFIDSWNSTNPNTSPSTSYGGTALYKATKTQTGATPAWGYYVGTTQNPTTTNVNMSSATGYNNTAFYPQHNATADSCYGYWLASASADNAFIVMLVYYGGIVGGYSTYNSTTYAFRPVVCLPSNIIK